MYKTERPFRVDVHRNSLFFLSGEGWGGRGGGDGVLCFVLCRYCQVGTYIILHTFLTHVIFLVQRLIFLLLLLYLYLCTYLIVREVLIARDSGRKIGRYQLLGSKTKHQQLF